LREENGVAVLECEVPGVSNVITPANMFFQVCNEATLEISEGFLWNSTTLVAASQFVQNSFQSRGGGFISSKIDNFSQS
jgi:hypothetical protein